MTVYISGKISGNPHFEREFYEAEKILKKSGYEVVNPLRIGKRLEERLSRQPTYEEYMQEDLKDLLKCDGIAMLDGWEESRGAVVEHDVAAVTGKAFVSIRWVKEE